MSHDRRSILSAIGVMLPFGLAAGARAAAPAAQTGPAPVLRLRSFEEAVRAAFDGPAPAGGPGPFEGFPCRRVEVGHSDLLQAGVQGCHNAAAFAGFPAEHLRIVRAGSEPGPARGGVRLYVATVDVALTGGRACAEPSRALDFAALPPAPTLEDGPPAPASTHIVHKPAEKSPRPA